MVYQTEKILADDGDKFSDSDKTELNDKMDALKEALKGEDLDAIKNAKEALTNKFYEVSQKLYESAQAQQGGAQGAGPQGGANAGQSGTEYTDADYNEVDDN